MMYVRQLSLLMVLTVLLGMAAADPVGAQEEGKKKRPLPPRPIEAKQKSADAPGDAAPSDAPVLDERSQKLIEMLSGVKLVGHFTVTGKSLDNLPKEEYTISSVKPLAGKLWLFSTRIQYGQRDVTLPLPLPVEWAGDTPVISMKNFTIPGLGTFDAHVVFDGDKYAGTWKHDEVGGHLFGMIEKLPAEEAEAEKKPAEADADAKPAAKPDAEKPADDGDSDS